MPPHAADVDKVGTGANRVGQGGLVVQLGAQLVEIGHAEFGAQFDRAAVRGLLAQNQF